MSASVALALSQIQDKKIRKELQNGAFIKEALIKSSRPLENLSITEQGAGVFDLDMFMAIVQSKADLYRQAVYQPTSIVGNGVEIYPSRIDIRSRTFQQSQRGFKNTSAEDGGSLFRRNVSVNNLTDLASFMEESQDTSINKTEQT